MFGMHMRTPSAHPIKQYATNTNGNSYSLTHARFLGSSGLQMLTNLKADCVM